MFERETLLVSAYKRSGNETSGLLKSHSIENNSFRRIDVSSRRLCCSKIFHTMERREDLQLYWKLT